MNQEMMSTTVAEAASGVNWKLEGQFLLNENLRLRSRELLDSTPFPTTRSEAWKYTRVAKIRNAALSVQPAATVTGNYRISDNSVAFVFVNGHFSPELSSASYPEGLKVLALSQMDEAERLVLGEQLPAELFNAFNTAYTTDGLYLHVSARMEIETAVEIIHISSGSHVLSNVRNFITCEGYSKLTVLQHFVSEEATECFTNVVTQVNVARNANLTIHKLQQEAGSCFSVVTEEVDQAQDSVFTINTVTLNGALVRNNLNIRVNGEHCETHLNGAYILKDNQHVDNHTVVDHKAANCNSNELYKGVADGKSTGVFNGKVFVRQHAQKINAFQSNGNVLLSEDASINSKPELEIYADDVKCSHGSTTGQLDEEAVFYLRARGIGEAAARQLMVGAFVGEVFEKIDHPEMLATINEVLAQRFDWVIE